MSQKCISEDSGTGSLDDHYPDQIEQKLKIKLSTASDISEKSEKSRKKKMADIDSLSEDCEDQEECEKDDKGMIRPIKFHFDSQEPSPKSKQYRDKRRNSHSCKKTEIEIYQSIQENICENENENELDKDILFRKSHSQVITGIDHCEFGIYIPQRQKQMYVQGTEIPILEEDEQEKQQKKIHLNTKLSNSLDKRQKEFQSLEKIRKSKEKKQKDVYDDSNSDDSNIQIIEEEEEKQSPKGVHQLQKAISKIHLEKCDMLENNNIKQFNFTVRTEQIEEIEEEEQNVYNELIL